MKPDALLSLSFSLPSSMLLDHMVHYWNVNVICSHLPDMGSCSDEMENGVAVVGVGLYSCSLVS